MDGGARLSSVGSESVLRVLLKSSVHSPSLPQMTPLVRGDNVQARSQAKADAPEERILESDPGQIQVRVHS